MFSRRTTTDIGPRNTDQAISPSVVDHITALSRSALCRLGRVKGGREGTCLRPTRLKRSGKKGPNHILSSIPRLCTGLCAQLEMPYWRHRGLHVRFLYGC
jgi:hypothetical protein